MIAFQAICRGFESHRPLQLFFINSMTNEELQKIVKESRKFFLLATDLTWRITEAGTIISKTKNGEIFSQISHYNAYYPNRKYPIGHNNKIPIDSFVIICEGERLALMFNIQNG